MQIFIPSPLSITDRTSRHTVGEGAEDKTANRKDLMAIYKTVLPTIAEHTVLSSMCGIFTEINLMLGHKTCLNKS